MAVRIRMKKMGRTHRAFFRVCAFDQCSPRDGKSLEELGTYDPSVPDSDARAVLNGERIAYWLSVGAQPTEKVAVLIKKYGKDGTHLAKQEQALSKLVQPKVVPPAGPAAPSLKQQQEAAQFEPEQVQPEQAEAEVAPAEDAAANAE